MGIMRTKILRDIWYSKGRSISIIVIVAISTALYGGLILAYQNIGHTFSDAETKTNFESARYIMPNYTDPTSIDLSGYSQYLDNWDSRLSIVTGMKLANKDRIFTLSMFGIATDHRPRVNDFQIEKGQFFSAGDEMAGKIMLTTQFMKANDLKVGDTIQIQTPTGFVSVTIAGQVFSNEYIYNVNPKTGLPDIQGLGAGWLPLGFVQSHFDLANKINEVVVRFNAQTEKDSGTRQVAALKILGYLQTKTDNVSFLFKEDEPEQKVKNSDVGSLDTLARVFGVLILFIALFVIYDNVSKLIASQRNYIGTMRALGGSKRVVAMQYTMIGIILGIIGVMLGLPLGWAIGAAMTASYATLLGIPEPNTQFHLSGFAEGIIVNLLLVGILSLLSARSAVNINPREAMSSSFITQIFTKKPWLEKFFEKIPGFNTPTGSIPVRSLVRHKRKTFLTIMTFSISIVLMLAAFGFLDSFNNGINQNYAHYEKYDMQVYFLEPLNIQEVDGIVNGLNYITQHDGFAAVPIQISNGGLTKNTALYGFNPNSNLRTIKLQSGKFDGLTLGVNLANYLHVGMGDFVNISGFSIPIAAISDEILSDSAMVPLQYFQTAFQLGQNVTGILIKIADGFTVNQVKEQLLQTSLPIGLMLSTEQVKNSINTLIQGLVAMIDIMVLIGFLIVALFSFNTVVLDVMTRQNEFVNIRSLGGSRRHVIKIIAFQGLVVSFFGGLLAIPIGYWVTDLMLKDLMQNIMVLPTVIAAQSYAIGIFSAYIASLTGVWAAVRYVMKIKLVDAMRTRISN